MSSLAAIDIGSNTILLTIAEERGGELVAVREECRFARLAEGLSQSGTLSPAAIERGLAVLRDYRAAIDEAGCTRVSAVATQAVREAVNRDEFTREAGELLGTALAVIDGEREAELVARAVLESVPGCRDGGVVIADVGGASTEVIVADAGAVKSTISLPIGAVRLTEDHLRSDPPAPAELTALCNAIDEALHATALPEVERLIGSAGTATTIATIEQRLLDYDPARVHGFTVPTQAVEHTLARLVELPLAERSRLRGLQPQRADVAPAGVAIYARLLARCRARELCVSDRGVRWGLLYESQGD